MAMNIEAYKKQREKLEKQAVQYRELCSTCVQPGFGCYCQHIQSFHTPIKFVILIHPIEVRRRIATGRMSHLCLKNSLLIHGQDYSKNDQVNEILEDPEHQSFVLYPGAQSKNLSDLSPPQRKEIFDSSKTPVLFVIDGTWATAKKMMRQSQNLAALPRLSFTPPKQSRFRVRKQPAPECLSTIEAIHHSLELLGPAVGFQSQEQNHLLDVFDKMVERQLDFIRLAQLDPSRSHYRKPQVLRTSPPQLIDLVEPCPEPCSEL